MKKAYSLDYSIERDVDRVEAVREILDTLNRDPNQTDLEQMASYILYGKDENGLNAVKRGEITDGNTRYSNFKTKADKNKSLDEILENPLTDERDLEKKDYKDRYIQKKRTIEHPKYDRQGNLISIGDGDIPGMADVWDTIARLEHWIAQLEGKIPPEPGVTLFEDSYRMYRLKHNLIEIRRQQYYLKDTYKPTIQFMNVDTPKAQFYDWSGDAFYWMPYEKWLARVNASYFPLSRNLSDYETRGSLETNDLEVKWVVCQHHFDWTDIRHVRTIIMMYHDLEHQLHDKLNTYGRTLIWDFDRYVQLADFSPLRLFLIDCRRKGMDYDDILYVLERDWNIIYNKNHLGSIYLNEIPKKIVETVLKENDLIDIPKSEWKRCFRCGQLFPRTTRFFGKNAGRRDGWCSNCKNCEKLRRIDKGVQLDYDGRSKDTTMR